MTPTREGMMTDDVRQVTRLRLRGYWVIVLESDSDGARTLLDYRRGAEAARILLAGKAPRYGPGYDLKALAPLRG